MRATGIADSRPAKSVGPAFAAAPNGGPAIDGHPPVALRLDVWETFGAGPLLLSLDGNGTGSMNGGAEWAIDSSRLLSVGTQIDTSPVQQTTLPTVLPNAVYIPIFEPITNPTTMAVERFLVGFGRVMIVSPPPTAQTVTIQRVRRGDRRTSHQRRDGSNPFGGKCFCGVHPRPGRRWVAPAARCRSDIEPAFHDERELAD